MSFTSPLEDPPQESEQDDRHMRDNEEVVDQQENHMPRCHPRTTPTGILFLRRVNILLLLSLILPGCLWTRGQHLEHIAIKTPLLESEYLILGFMGGRDSWDDERQGVRKLALRLRAEHLPGIHVETIENKKRRLAIELIRKAFDYNRNRELDSREKQSARIILYGQSFGGAAVVKLAGELNKMGIPVLLTVQVDSIGRHDDVIPPNVARAANLFQRNGIFIRGEPEIHAEDRTKTAIVGNFEFDYRNQEIDISHVPWFKKIFRVAHTRMDRDPEVWSKVEELILTIVDR